MSTEYNTCAEEKHTARSSTQNSSLAEHSSPTEIVYAQIREFSAAIKELEDLGIIQNAKVILFGSTISEFKRPSDIDLLVIFDSEIYTKKNQETNEIPKDGLSITATKLLKKLEQRKSGGTVDFNFGFNHENIGIEYHLMSQSEFLELFNAEKEANKYRALKMIKGLSEDPRIEDEEIKSLIAYVPGIISLVEHSYVEEFSGNLLPLVRNMELQNLLFDSYVDHRILTETNLQDITLECARSLSNHNFSPQLKLELLALANNHNEQNILDKRAVIGHLVMEISDKSPYFASKLLKSQLWHYYSGTNWIQALVESGATVVKGKNIIGSDNNPIFKREDRTITE